MALALEGAVLRGRRIARGTVAVRDGRVAPDAPRGARRRLPDGWLVAPGLVDLQVNGFGGAEVGGDPDAIAAVAAALPRTGVTAFCPTLVSRDDAGYDRAARALAAAVSPPGAARILAPHLEGPFLNPSRHGAHDLGVLRAPDPDAVDRLLAAFRPALLTLAPELPGGLDAIRRASRSCVVAIGHTEADAEVGRAAVAAGARLVTHALNAMRGIVSREPSALAAVLAGGRAHVSLIADGVHVAPEVAVALARAAGPRLVLVSDASAPAGAPPGRYRLGPREVASDGIRVTDGGTLAGSARGLGEGPGVLTAAGLPRAAAVAAAATAPRRLLGLPGAALAPGDPADLVVLDEAMVPRLTLVAGEVAWAAPDLPFGV